MNDSYIENWLGKEFMMEMVQMCIHLLCISKKYLHTSIYILLYAYALDMISFILEICIFIHKYVYLFMVSFTLEICIFIHK